MDTAHLEAFVMVADLGSFTRAAARLRLSQPCVTTRLQALEAEVGTRLLNRLYRSVSPTPAGLELLPLAHDILRLTRLARAVSSDDKALPRGRISLGAVESLMTCRVLPVVAHLSRSYPALEVEVSRVVSDECGAELRAGRLDCALVVVGVPEPASGLERHVMGVEPLCVLASPNHPLATEGEPTLDDLRTAVWVRSDKAEEYHALFMETLSTSEGAPPRTIVLGSLDAVKQGVKSEIGLTFMPRAAALDELAAGVLVELPWNPPFDIFTQLMWRRGGERPRSMRRLLDEVIRLLDVNRGKIDPKLRGALN